MPRRKRTDPPETNPMHVRTVNPTDPVDMYQARREGVSRGKAHVFKSEEERTKSIARLTPFKKGEAPAHTDRLKEMDVRKTLRRSIAQVFRAIGDEEVDETRKWTAIEAVIRRLYADAIGGKVAAAELILERGWGKVPQQVTVDLKSEVVHLIETSGLSREDVMSDPILSQIAQDAGLLIEGEVLRVTESV